MTVPCSYAKLGEIDSNIQTLLDNQDPNLADTGSTFNTTWPRFLHHWESGYSRLALGS